MLSADASRRLRLITLTEDLDYSDITKTESNNCFITHCFEMNNDKHTVAWNRFELPSEIMHCACILQISRLRLFPKLSVGS